MNKLAALIFLSSASAFALDIPDRMNCTQQSVFWRTPTPPKTVTVSYKESRSLCPTCGTNKYYEMTYADASVVVVTDSYVARNMEFLSDSTFPGPRYFAEQCGP